MNRNHSKKMTRACLKNAEYYFGNNPVLERAEEENEFEGSLVEEEDMNRILLLQEKLAVLPSFWKDLTTKLLSYCKDMIVQRAVADEDVGGLEIMLYGLEERVFEAHPCQINLVKEIDVRSSYYFATKIFEIILAQSDAEVPDLAAATFCYLVQNRNFPLMDKYKTNMLFVREDEVDPATETDCPNWRSFWTEALCHDIDRRTVEEFCNWPGKPQRIVTFDDGSTIIVQTQTNKFYLIKQCLVCSRKWKYGNYSTPYVDE